MKDQSDPFFLIFLVRDDTVKIAVTSQPATALYRARNKTGDSTIDLSGPPVGFSTEKAAHHRRKIAYNLLLDCKAEDVVGRGWIGNVSGIRLQSLIELTLES